MDEWIDTAFVGITGGFVLLDAADVPLLQEHRWYVSTAGYVVANGKMTSYVKEPSFYLHRLIAGCTPGDGQVVDHLNREKFDNRRCNLRVGTVSDNAQNVGSHRDAQTSAHRGVSYSQANKVWYAEHMLRGVRRRSRWKTEAEAVAAVEAMRAEALHV